MKHILIFVIFCSTKSFCQCWKQVKLSENHALGIKTDSTLWAWGINTSGQLGDSTIAGTLNLPAQISNSNVWREISVGQAHSLAIKIDGTLWVWGSNFYGTLGDGTNIKRKIPTKIGNMTDWKLVGSAWESSYAIKNNGSLWAWGRNDDNELANGTLVDSNTPIKIGNDSNWIYVNGGMNFAAGLKADSSLWYWGNFLGPSTGINQIPGKWQKVATGANHIIGIKNDGTLWGIGSNGQGAIGTGTQGNAYYSPVSINNGSWNSITAGSHFSLGLKNDGSVWAWGLNSLGQLGDSTASDKYSPKQIIPSTYSVVEISAGFMNSSCITTNNILYNWGKDGNLATGNACQICSRYPVSVTCQLIDIDEIIKDNYFKVFPNPSTGILKVISSKKLEVKFYNMLGQQLNVQSTSEEIDLSNLEKGIYLIEIVEGNKREVRKIILN